MVRIGNTVKTKSKICKQANVNANHLYQKQLYLLGNLTQWNVHGDQRWFQMPAYLHNGNWADIVCVSKFISISAATTTLHFDNWITDIAKKH